MYDDSTPSPHVSVSRMLSKKGAGSPRGGSKGGNSMMVAILSFLLVGYLIVMVSILKDGDRVAPVAVADASIEAGYSSSSSNTRLGDKGVAKSFQSHIEAQDASNLLDKMRPSRADNEQHRDAAALPVGDRSPNNVGTAVKLNLRTSLPQPFLPSVPEVRTGVIVLGMHRSGTSVIGGLLASLGFQTGHPLIGPAADNAKGFFERVDVVLQNDYLMKLQNIHYSAGTYRYDAELGAKHIKEMRRLHAEQESDPVASRKAMMKKDLESRNGGEHVYENIKANAPTADLFNEGERGLNFLNNPHSVPWMLKDPRLCITVKTWMPFLNHVPAVLFTYRHPLDVASSLHKRDNMRMRRGLKMWYIYNKRAIESSGDLCRVVSTHKGILTSPEKEVQRVYTELKGRCGVPVPRAPSRKIVEEFVDVKLNHGGNTGTVQAADPACVELKRAPSAKLTPPEKTWVPDMPASDLRMYTEVMRVYCAMEDGSAFDAGFHWDATLTDA